MTALETIGFYVLSAVFVGAVIRFTLWATQPTSDETMLEQYWRDLEDRK